MADDPLSVGAASPSDEALTQQRNDALARSTGAIDTAAQSMNAEAGLAERKAKELAPMRERALQQVNQPLPQPPKLKEPPAPPKQAQGADEGWLLAVQVLGGLVGAATRRPLTNALAGMTGAINGYQEGNRQKFDQNLAVWDRENKAAVESNQKALDEYREILENRKLNESQVTMALQIAAARHEDDAMAMAAKTKSSLVIAQLYDRQFEALSRMKSSSDQLRQQHQSFHEREWESQAANFVAKNPNLIEAIRRGERPPPSTNTRTGLQGAIDRAIWSELYAHGDFDAGKFAREQATLKAASTAEARARAQIDPATERRTLGAFAAGPEARNVRSLNVAIAHLGTLEELGKALGSSDFPRLNQLSNLVETELGYAMPTNFNAARQIVSAEIIKAIVQNGGGVQERQRAEDAINTAGSWDQLNGVIRTYKSLLAGQMMGLKKQYESGSKRKDFLDKLEPETIKALEQAGVAPDSGPGPIGYRKTGDETPLLQRLDKQVGGSPSALELRQ